MRLRSPKLRCVLLTTALTFVAIGEARATPNFPAALAADIQLSSPPDCSLCHTDGDQGGDGTVNTPFGKNMRARGLVAYDTASLSAALTMMSDEKVDSAGACLPDIEELQAGGDPNTPASGGCDGGAAPPAATQTAVLLPTYGCTTSPGGSPAPRPATILLAATLGLVFAARRRRGRSREARVSRPSRPR
jgi:MYXO-CTERM domain-containing protein